MAKQEEFNTITVTVGQKKATNFSREVFDANESVTLVNTNAEEAGLLRNILRIKLLGSIIHDMIAYSSVTSEVLDPSDVAVFVNVADIRLRAITDKLSELELPNKEELVLHLAITNGIVEQIREELDGLDG